MKDKDLEHQRRRSLQSIKNRLNNHGTVWGGICVGFGWCKKKRSKKVEEFLPRFSFFFGPPNPPFFFSLTLAGWLQIMISYRAQKTKQPIWLVHFCNHWAMATTLSEKRTASNKILCVGCVSWDGVLGLVYRTKTMPSSSTRVLMVLDTFRDVTLNVFSWLSHRVSHCVVDSWGSEKKKNFASHKEKKKGTKNFFFFFLWGFQKNSPLFPAQLQAPGYQLQASGNSRHPLWGWSKKGWAAF